MSAGRLRRLRLERRELASRRIDWRTGAETCGPTSMFEHEELWAAIWRLPVPQRAVVVLRLVEDRSEDDVSSLLHIPVATVKSRLARALGARRVQLEETA